MPKLVYMARLVVEKQGQLINRLDKAQLIAGYAVKLDEATLSAGLTQDVGISLLLRYHYLMNAWKSNSTAWGLSEGT